MAEMINVESAKLRIREAQLKAAAEAIFAPSHPVSQYTLVTALLEKFENWSFDAYLTAEGELNVIGYWGSELDDADVQVLQAFFTKLAPHVSEGEILFSGEDIGELRWLFDGGQLHSQIVASTWQNLED